jgi:hypothetical protein
MAVTAIHDEGDGLTLCEQHSWVMTTPIVTLLSKCCCGVLLFSLNLIDMLHAVLTEYVDVVELT